MLLCGLMVVQLNTRASCQFSSNVTWNFFDSRHGKGEADGESAVVKGKLD